MMNNKKTNDLNLKELKEIFQKLNVDINNSIQEKNVKILPSKKHTVIHLTLEPNTLLERFDNSPSMVVKIFQKNSENLERKQREFDNYETLGRLALSGKIPKRYGCSERAIIYEYISGQEYRNLLLAKKLTETQCVHLGNWFRELHEHELTFFDSRLSNFMVSETDDLVVIDFEDIRPGDVAEDLAKISSSFLDYTPGVFDNVYNPEDFTRLVDFLLSYFLFDRKMIMPKQLDSITNQWTQIVIQGLTHTAQRRSYTISVQIWNQIHKKVRSQLNENISNHH